MSRVLVTEVIAEPGLEKLRHAGHEVDVQLGLSPEALVEAVVGAQALIVRSATTVTEEVLLAGTDLMVVGRAGVGLDNVDVDTATRRGVMVVNAPQSNVVSAAEQTMALILAQARNVPQAAAALREGRWERSKWTGMELHDKTLGIIGLGRIGKLVAQRALAFGMRLIAYDPFISEDRARQLSVDLVDLDTLAANADVVTVHVARTPETVGMVGADFFSKAKDGVRIINVARGGIVDEAALVDAIGAGKVGGAGLDVFSTEPMTESPLFTLDQVVATPHLGASTVEAQDKAGVTIAEQVNLALAGDFVPFAVNVDAAEVAGVMRPFLPLAEQLGALFANLVLDPPDRPRLPAEVEVTFAGEIGEFDNRLAGLAVIKGLLSAVTEEPVSFVNAQPLLAKSGCEVQVVGTSVTHDFVNRLEIRAGEHSLAATLLGLENEPRLIEVSGHDVDLPPGEHMLVVRNDDRPGMIGQVGTVLGAAEINIDDMDVGRDGTGVSAVMVITTRQPVPAEVRTELETIDGIISVDYARTGPVDQLS